MLLKKQPLKISPQAAKCIVDLERKRERGLVIEKKIIKCVLQSKNISYIEFEANSILRRQEPTTQPKLIEVWLRFVYFAEIENFLFKIR